MRIAALLLVLSGAVLSSCGLFGGPPARKPDISGTVTSVTDNGDGTYVVYVEATRTGSLGPKAIVTVGSGTKVYHEAFGGGRQVPASELAADQLVGVWFDERPSGQPPQADAVALLITNDPQPTTTDLP